nr:carbohydrate-binding protein [Planctomycetota bacterium]
ANWRPDYIFRSKDSTSVIRTVSSWIIDSSWDLSDHRPVMVDIVVTGGGTSNNAPSVAMTAPANNTSVTAGSNVTLGANASDSDGSVAKVEFFRGATKIGEDTTSPYSIVWSNVAAGTYALTAKATDNAGATATSATVTVTATAVVTPGTVSLPGRVQAEDYTSYLDDSSTNEGGQYRSDGVDIETCSAGGYCVGWIGAGEWLQYDVTVATAGSYTVTTSVASAVSGTKTLHITIDGVDVTGAMSFTDASGWQSWVRMTSGTVSLSAGTHTMRVAMDTSGFNVDYIDVATAAGSPAITLPARLQAEDYARYSDTSAGNSGGAYRSDGVDIEPTTDAGGGQNVGWIAAGEWLEFDVRVATAGAYALRARVASSIAGTKTLRVRIDGADVSGAMSFTDASGWQSWADVTATATLAAGNHVLRIAFDTGGMNLNYLDVTAAAGSGWTNATVGAVAVAGSSTIASARIDVRASGGDLYGSTDAFHMVYRRLTGDGSIVARVTTVQNTNEWAQAGIMMRRDLGASSPHASLMVTQIDRCKFRRRVSDAGATTSTGTSPGSGLRLPQWLKLVRTGNVFTAARSVDGATWTDMGSETIAMGSTVYIGVWASSVSSVLGGATLDNIAITPASGATLAGARVATTAMTEGGDDVRTSGTADSGASSSPAGAGKNQCGLGGGLALLLGLLFRLGTGSRKRT